jgi:hypothetical protein
MRAIAARPTPQRIELMVRAVDALFNSMDPAPFHEKHLDREAEAFIVSSARQYPPGTPLVLQIHLQEAAGEGAAEAARDAIHNFFSYRKELTSMEFRRLMREGRISLLIGLTFLFTCLLVQRYLLAHPESAFLALLRESLTIAGWVGMWQPIQTYLYDWWPLRRHRRVFSRLSRVPVELMTPRSAATSRSNVQRKHQEALLDQALADSFPASDPVSTLKHDSPPPLRQHKPLGTFEDERAQRLSELDGEHRD